MHATRYALIAALLFAGCGKSADDKPRAAPAAPKAAVAADYLPLTAQAIAELPESTYKPEHSDAEYSAIQGTGIPLKFYIEPLNEQMLDARGAQMQADFKRVLGRTISDVEAQRWKGEMIEDIRRRRLAARALLDMYLAGKLTDVELDDRFYALHEGIDLAFRRITQITLDEHALLAGTAGP